MQSFISLFIFIVCVSLSRRSARVAASSGRVPAPLRRSVRRDVLTPAGSCQFRAVSASSTTTRLLHRRPRRRWLSSPSPSSSSSEPSSTHRQHHQQRTHLPQRRHRFHQQRSVTDNELDVLSQRKTVRSLQHQHDNLRQPAGCQKRHQKGIKVHF